MTRCRPAIKGGAYTYPGGTGKHASILLRYFPPTSSYDTYSEPFVGGGSVFWAHPLCNQSRVVLGDKDPVTIRILRDIQSGQLKQDLSKFKCIQITPELFAKLPNSSHPLHNIAFYQTAYLAKRVNPSLRSKYKTSSICFTKLRSNIDAMKEKIQNTEIVNEDYAETIKSIDGKRTFFYLDPPWPGSEARRMYRHHEMDWIKYISILASIVGRFFSYTDWDDKIAKKAQSSGLRVYRIKSRKSAWRDPSKRIGSSGARTESSKGYMIITNYKLKIPQGE